MLLSKKNAHYFNKPKPNDPPKPKRILGGWQQTNSSENPIYGDASQPKPGSSRTLPPPNLLEQDLLGQSNQTTSAAQPGHSQDYNIVPTTSNQKFYFNWDELNERNDIECEKKLIEDLVQPGGIRVKPSESQLNELLTQTKGMEVHVVGSLLLSKLQVNYPFQIKAKALYAMEFLAKKNDKYVQYFKAYSKKLEQFPQPDDNAEAYRKVLKNVLSLVVSASQSDSSETNQSTSASAFNFVDPGYNDDPRSTVGDFLSANANKAKKGDGKKKIVGPGQKAPEQTKGADEQTVQSPSSTSMTDLMSLNLLGFGSPTSAQTSSSKPMDFNLM